MNLDRENERLGCLGRRVLVLIKMPLALTNINFGVAISLDDIIYNRTTPPKNISFSHLSRLAHSSHNSINRRYRKFMRFKRSNNIDINKSRAKKCCGMVKKHIHDLKWIRAYLYKTNMAEEHPIFIEKIDTWIKECEGIHSRYKYHIKEL